MYSHRFDHGSGSPVETIEDTSMPRSVVAFEVIEGPERDVIPISQVTIDVLFEQLRAGRSLACKGQTEDAPLIKLFEDEV